MQDEDIVTASVPLSVATVLSSLCCKAHDLAAAASERHALLVTTRKKQLEFRDSLLSLPSRLRRRVRSSRQGAVVTETQSPDAELVSFDRLLDRMADMCEGRRRMLPAVLSMPHAEPIASLLLAPKGASPSTAAVSVPAGDGTAPSHSSPFSTVTLTPLAPTDDGRSALRGYLSRTMLHSSESRISASQAPGLSPEPPTAPESTPSASSRSRVFAYPSLDRLARPRTAQRQPNSSISLASSAPTQITPARPTTTTVRMSGGPRLTRETAEAACLGMNATTAAKLAFVSVEEGCGPHSDDKCAVCLGEYVAGQRLCFLPCSHKYHAQCVIPWLLRKAVCPLCKSRL